MAIRVIHAKYSISFSFFMIFKEKYKYDRNVHIIPTGIEIERFYKENLSKEKLSDLKNKLKINAMGRT